MNAARLYALYKGAFEHKRQARQTGFRVLKPLPEQPLDGGQHNGFTEHGSSGRQPSDFDRGRGQFMSSEGFRLVP